MVKQKKQNVGLEKSYDSLLTGQKGQRLVRLSPVAFLFRLMATR
jgi:hypothetical protein